MRRSLQIFTLLAALLLSAGSVSMVNGGPRRITYSPASNQGYPGKPANCPLVVLSTPPQQAYVELGTFDIDYSHTMGGGEIIRSVADLRRILGPQACRLGADALLAYSFAGGAAYTRAVALRWTPPPAPLPAAAPTAATR